MPVSTRDKERRQRGPARSGMEIQQNGWIRFFVSDDACRKGKSIVTGWFGVDDIVRGDDEPSKMPDDLKQACQSILRMNTVAKLYVDLGSSAGPYVAVKFKDGVGEPDHTNKVGKILNDAGLT